MSQPIQSESKFDRFMASAASLVNVEVPKSLKTSNYNNIAAKVAIAALVIFAALALAIPLVLYTLAKRICFGAPKSNSEKIVEKLNNYISNKTEEGNSLKGLEARLIRYKAGFAIMIIEMIKESKTEPEKLMISEAPKLLSAFSKAHTMCCDALSKNNNSRAYEAWARSENVDVNIQEAFSLFRNEIVSQEYFHDQRAIFDRIFGAIKEGINEALDLANPTLKHQLTAENQ